MHFPSETDGESSMTEGPISRMEIKTRRTISGKQGKCLYISYKYHDSL